MGNRAAKGSDFERQFCRRLSLWWTAGEDDSIFWRTSQSGGRATTRAKAGKRADRHCGDLCAIDPIGEPLLRLISWELKRGYNRATFHELLDKPAQAKPPLYQEWFAKAESDRERAGAVYWALVHKRDRREPLLVTQAPLIWHLERLSGWGNASLPGGVYPVGPVSMVEWRREPGKERNLMVLTVDEFLAVRPDAMLQMLAQREGRSA